MKYSVVIVTYNRCDLLKKCVECVEKQTLSPVSVIIVDNNSTDTTKNYLSSIRDSMFQVIELNENLGASGGFAKGISEAVKLDSDYVLIIDDDAHIDEHYLEYIDEFLSYHTDIRAASGTVVELDNVALVHRRRIKNKCTLSYFNVGLEEYNSEFFMYDFFSFCGIVISRKILLEIGLPRTDFFTQFTDTDYSLKVRKKTEIANVNKAILYHRVKRGKGVQGISYKMYYQVRNRIVTIISNASTLMKPIMKIALIIAYKTRIALRWFKMHMDSRNRELYQKQIEIFSDAYHDAIKGKLGINPKYLPGY